MLVTPTSSEVVSCPRIHQVLSSVQRLLTTVQTVALSPVSSAPYHHLPTPPRASSQPFSTPLPQNTRPNTPPPEPLPTPETKAPKRRIQANPNPVPPAMRASANTCHDLLVIGPQRQNPCCRTLAFTCADARCPSSPGSHDFGPPAPASWYNGSPKNPPARRPAVPSIRRERPSPNQNPWPSLFTQPRPTAPPLRTPTTKPHLVSRITDFSTYPPHNALPQTRQNEHHSLLPEPPGSCAPHGDASLSPRPESHV